MSDWGGGSSYVVEYVMKTHFDRSLVETRCCNQGTRNNAITNESLLCWFWTSYWCFWFVNCFEKFVLTWFLHTDITTLRHMMCQPGITVSFKCLFPCSESYNFLIFMAAFCHCTNEHVTTWCMRQACSFCWFVFGMSPTMDFVFYDQCVSADL